MDSKHTPGLWTVRLDPEYPEEAFSITNGEYGNEIAGRIGSKADADLMAAAPAMHDTLDMVRNCINGYVEKDDPDMLRAALDLIELAFEKTRGE